MFATPPPPCAGRCPALGGRASLGRATSGHGGPPGAPSSYPEGLETAIALRDPALAVSGAHPAGQRKACHPNKRLLLRREGGGAVSDRVEVGYAGVRVSRAVRWPGGPWPRQLAGAAVETQSVRLHGSRRSSRDGGGQGAVVQCWPPYHPPLPGLARRWGAGLRPAELRRDIEVRRVRAPPVLRAREGP
jgi:hypothetical protein